MEAIRYAVQHVFMPPKLPQRAGDPTQDMAMENALARYVHESAEEYMNLMGESYENWKVVVDCLHAMSRLHTDAPYTTSKLEQRFEDMLPGDVIALLVRKQNAGLIIRRNEDDTVVFEVFEVTAPAARVVQSVGKLRWTFPGAAVAISKDEFIHPDFRAQLASFIAHMNRDELDLAARETNDVAVHPKFITNLLMTILAAVGGGNNAIIAPSRRVTKRIADDALSESSRSMAPWRRSPLWLVIRVLMQTTLTDPTEYKSFMIYFMASLTKKAIDFESATLVHMRKKIARRAAKLGEALQQEAIEEATSACESAQDVIRGRWEKIQEAESQPISNWEPYNLDVDSDTQLQLNHSTPYITNALYDHSSLVITSSYIPKHARRLQDFPFHDMLRQDLLSFREEKDASLVLADFEAAVRSDLGGWIEMSLTDSTAPTHLFSKMKQYADLASVQYRENAEQQSLMVLVLLELWVALDRIVVDKCPLLASYPPEIPISLLEPLLFRSAGELARVRDVAIYLQRRTSEAKTASRPSLFGKLSAWSFSAKYYATSQAMRAAKDLIEKKANKRKKEKTDELKDKNQEQAAWVRKCNRTEHSEECAGGFSRKRKYKNCPRCLLEGERPTITRYEWPLPDSELQLQNVIFELYCPSYIAIWREATYMLLYDRFTASDVKPRGMGSATGIQSYMSMTQGMTLSGTSNTRISLAAIRSSGGMGAIQLPASSSDVCVEHQKEWHIYDSNSRNFITCDLDEKETTFHVAGTRQFGTLVLPPSKVYKGLQYTVSGTLHTENQVQAKQAECPYDLSLHEYLAFGTLRSGSVLQWMNIAKAFATRSLTFNSQCVHVLISQAVQQLGRLSTVSGTPVWHVELRSPSFCESLLGVMKRVLDDSVDNWREVATVKTIILVAVRLLSGVNEEGTPVMLAAQELLGTARDTTYRWLKSIIGQLETTPQNEVDAMKARICEIAGTCCLTFDVDNRVLSAADIAIFIHASIAINSNSPSKRDTSSAPARLLLDRVQRLLHSLEDELWEHISVDPQGLDDAVRAVWSSYLPGTPWQRMPSPDNRWLFCKTQSSNQNVQINLLSGELFIDGKPIGNLPKRITEDPIYTRLFGKAVLRVVPAGIAEMDYKSVLDISGYEVFFAVKEDGPVIIRARPMNDKFDAFQEYIPYTYFSGDLPVPFVEDYVHWLNMDTAVIEFRPLKTLWTPSSLNWTIDFHAKVMKDHRDHRLVDLNSATFRMVHSRLQAFEDSSFVVMTKDSMDTLEINLPRFQLDFTLDTMDGELESKTYPLSIVDPDQSPQTLYGLKSKLTLRQRRPRDMDLDLPVLRHVLIPRGVVRFTPDADGNHVEVEVDTDVAKKRSVPYLVYTVNTKLGSLATNGSLEAKLYKIYLHALTSHCAPDPLLGRTGVEEALNELASETCMSFSSLDLPKVELLTLIRGLTPRREYHPPRKHETQSIHWLDIPATSQVTPFERLVARILDWNDKLSVYSETSPTKKELKEKENLKQHSPPPLLRRAAVREYPFADVLTMPKLEAVTDDVYLSRDGMEDSSDWALAAATMILKKDPRKFPVAEAPKLYEMFKDDWNPMLRYDLDDVSPLSYTRRWLNRGDFGRSFLPLYELCIADTLTHDEKLYSLLFSLPALAFGGSLEARIIPYLGAFALLSHKFFHVAPLRSKSFELKYGTYPRNEDINPIVRRHIRLLEETPSNDLMQLGDEEVEQYVERRRKHYNEHVAIGTTRLVKQVLELYLIYHHPTMPALPDEAQHDRYHRAANVMDDAHFIFKNCHHNGKLKAFATQIHDVLTPLHIPTRGDSFPTLISAVDDDSQVPQPTPTFDIINLQRLMRARDAPSLDDHVLTNLSTPENRAPANLKIDAPSVVALKRTLDEFSETTIPLQSQYGKDMQTSLNRLKSSLQANIGVDRPQGIDVGLHLHSCRVQFVAMLEALEFSFSHLTELERLLGAGGMWPFINIRTVLFQLTRPIWIDLSPEWQAFLTTFAIALIRLQQAERMSALVSANKREELEREIGNMRLLDVDLFTKYPDWLLIMIEHNFFARAIQIQVALEMFTPSSGTNTALQLNMGEGKSSVIAPMVAASLADGQKFVRIVVLKPLAPQMLQLFIDRLSSLPNRRICYFPFTRQMKCGLGGMTRIHNLNMQCMLDGAVVIEQPEHILSAKLLTIDKMLMMREDSSDEVRQEATEALTAQHWLEDRARDILDESDEVLHVRYQLIYTKGTQCPMEGHPDRWTVIQDVLRLAARVVDELAEMDDAIEVRRSEPWAFPHVKIPQQDGEGIIEELLSRMVEAVMEEELRSIPTKRFTPAAQKSLRKYLTRKDANNDGLILRRALSPPAFNAVLIVRGILAYGLLIYVLQDRRWRVDYGLDLSRLMLAVPYRAKDLPSLRSEFGHPDIAILLTCLAYYYHGLNQDQMDATIKHLLILSNPMDHYAQWVSDIPPDRLPLGLRDLNGMNIDDGQQRVVVFELFRYNRVVIDFYLASIVFPKAAKEFPHKLPTNGWDLSEKKANVTTGFSGTNDNRYLLPTSIRQEDPVDQGGTNALVLTYLLRPENAWYKCTRNANGKTCSGFDIIKLLAEKPAIRVLLDVGAQMLDMSNQALVDAWLALMPPEVEAAIFFNSDDEMMTITRSGIVVPLISSPYKQQTDKCIVYLDDAHTRGTDLKLPIHWQAAVTLGKKVTKDRLVQGCMRMRQLGRGQSLAFFAPPEVDAAIRRNTPRLAQSPRAKVQISDIIKWCMLETCADIEHHFPQWVQQGVDYDVRSKALRPLRGLDALTEDHVKLVENVWLQKEARKLAEMYEGGPSDSLGRYIRRYPLLHERLKSMGLEAMAHDNMDEEQEREVIHEMEVERHPERPPPVDFAKHILDIDVKRFVETGKLDISSAGFTPISSVLDHVPYWHDHSHNAPFDEHLLTTTDFVVTIKGDRRTRVEVQFWKQAHWLLSTNVANAEQVLVLISQWEAQNVLHLIRNKGPRSPVRLHLYSPRVTRNAQTFDDLTFYSIPPLEPSSPRPSSRLVMQLNIMAGQLYPSSFEEYTSLCQFLGVVSTETLVAQADGFVLPANRKEHMQDCPFTASPVGFLKELMAVRRKGQDFALTPMGKILNGYRLTEGDFV